jgi:hypothetical protein
MYPHLQHELWERMQALKLVKRIMEVCLHSEMIYLSQIYVRVVPVLTA